MELLGGAQGAGGLGGVLLALPEVGQRGPVVLAASPASRVGGPARGCS